MNKKNILIEFVVTNQCNKRCKYCDLNFSDSAQSIDRADMLIKFLINNSDGNNNYIINFFGGEPLLEFELIEYVLKKSADIKSLSFTIGTNGILLDETKYKILKSYDVEIYFSIDTETYEHIFKKEYILGDSEVNINFILNPHTIDLSFIIFQRLIKSGFEKFSVIPVYITIDWDLQSYKKLKVFKDMLKDSKNSKAYMYSYYERPTSDLQFILDTNGYLYRDVHTHLWFLKQFDIVPNEQQQELEKFSKMCKFEENLDIQQLIFNHKEGEVLKKSFLIPKYIGFSITLGIIHRIIKG